MAKAEHIINKLLLEIATEQNFVNYDVKIEPMSSGGANYTSSLYNVTVTEGDNVVHMFAKVAAVGEAMRSQGPKYFKTESFAYTKLAKVYEQLQEKHQVPQEHRLVFSKFYGCNPHLYEETVVLENLVMAGYQAYDRFKSIDWEYAQSAFTELAKMHALAFAYGEYHCEEFNEILEDLKFEFVMDSEDITNYTTKMLQTTIDATQPENREKVQKFFEVFDKDSFTKFIQYTRRPALGHGDYRPSNLMHKIRKVS